MVRQLMSQLSQVPDIRQEKVDALRSEIQSGQFHRSNDQVAGALVTQLFGINSNEYPSRSRMPWRRLHLPVSNRLPTQESARRISLLTSHM
jgi:hypothetical protein